MSGECDGGDVDFVGVEVFELFALFLLGEEGVVPAIVRLLAL